MERTSNNRRIAKNTLLLYVRTFFVMIISIFASRIILQALGVEDYGVYNVVGGVVSMLSIISNSVTAAISRFITYEIGSENRERLFQVFATSKMVLLVLVGIVFILTELVGVWLLTTKMQIPDGRMTAAMWVLQCSIVSFCVNLLSIPYTACVIAHEHMNVFAYISVLDALLKLGICYLLIISPVDRLITYASLTMSIAILIRCLYNVYCHRHFEESRSSIRFYKPIYKEMFGFAGWSFFTSANHIFSNQGVNFLVNIYYGVVFNAARGVANQVQGAMTQFVSSFVAAINPQITKSYAAGEMENMKALVCRGARFSYYLTLIMVVPFFFEAESILNLWLTVVPEKAILFTRLSLLYILMDGAGYTSYTANLATGRIKKYSIVLSTITFFIFPLTWIAYHFGSTVETAYYLALIANLFYHIARMFLTQENVGISVKTFILEVYWPVLLTTMISIIPSVLICHLMPPSFLRLVLSIVVGVCITSCVALTFGMTKKERTIILEKAKKIMNNVFHVKKVSA